MAGPSIERRTTTGEYIGLDVSLKETAISVRRAGKRVWRGKCPSDPALLAAVIRKRAPDVERVVFETAPLSVWFFHALSAEGLPAICIDARHAKAALDMAANKTDANDADGLAQLAEVGFYREVRVKGFDSMLSRALVAARTRLVRTSIELSNQIRGLMKTFGLVVPRSAGGSSKAMSTLCSPTGEIWRGSSGHCLRPGEPCAFVQPNWEDSCWSMRGAAKAASSLCRSPASGP